MVGVFTLRPRNPFPLRKRATSAESVEEADMLLESESMHKLGSDSVQAPLAIKSILSTEHYPEMPVSRQVSKSPAAAARSLQASLDSMEEVATESSLHSGMSVLMLSPPPTSCK